MELTDNIHLTPGGHRHGPGYCLMEYIAVHKLDQYKTDYPEGIDRLVATAGQLINDSCYTDAQRQKLKTLVDRILTCAPVEDRAQRSRLHTAMASWSDDVMGARLDYSIGYRYPSSSSRPTFMNHDENWGVQLLTRFLDAYDKVVGTSWQDRAVPEIPPLMEEIFTTTPPAYESGGIIAEMAKGPMVDPEHYKPSLKTKVLSVLKR